MSRLDATEVRAAEPPPAPVGGKRRSFVPWLGVLAITASALVSSNAWSLRDRLFGTVTPRATAPAAGRVAGGTTQDTVAAAPTSLRSEPWWQDVATLDGTGTSTSSAFSIAAGALQWRVKWTCDSGHLVVRSPKQPKPVVDGPCTTGGVGYGVQTGPVSLDVTADGPWHLQVAQQIDTPLVEPPLPAMTAPGASVAATGSFYNIDKTGTGKVTVYRQADGRYSLRLDDFFVSPNSDLELRFSTLDAPHSSQEFAANRSELVVVMDVTAGSLNYPVPAGLDPSQFRSVVVWCRPISSAYAAASLGGTR